MTQEIEHILGMRGFEFDCGHCLLLFKMSIFVFHRAQTDDVALCQR